MTNWLANGVEIQRGQYRFTVKERADGTPWIATEPAGDTIKIPGPKDDDLTIGFTLRPGATVTDAHWVSACLNTWLRDIVLA